MKGTASNPILSSLDLYVLDCLT
uniref:Uncharacterized protein n=1 Tax=Rhizophora mucronata TaxID=61149 RepID=A0A2P2R1E4_RHIMU